MYYDSKSSFYVKQYGPKVFIIVFSLLLVSAGLYIYMRNNEKHHKVNQFPLIRKNKKKLHLLYYLKT